MVADEQTHTLPAERESLDRFARFAGFDGRDAFAAALLPHLHAVQRHYARLFEDAPAQAALQRGLVFTARPTMTRDARQARRHGLSRRRSRSPTRCAAGSPARRAALKGAGRAQSSRRTGVGAARPSRPRRESGRRARRLRSLPWPPARRRNAVLRCSTRIRICVALVAHLLGTAPRLADILAQHPQVMDALIDPAFFGALPDADQAAGRARALARTGAHLRGFPRPRAAVRPGAHVPDRRAHPVRHGVGASRRARRSRGLADVVIRSLHHTVEENLRRSSTAAFPAARARSSPWASSAGAR